MELKKILVPVDGSVSSMRAAGYAAELAKAMNSEILLIHCHKSFPVVLGEPYFQKAVDKIIKKSDALLEPYRKMLQDSGAAFADKILEGPADDTICEVAKIEKIDMIVMGSRGRSDLEGLLLGSCTHRVLSMAEVPVLVVK
jgi:nucleotide-binding universal stress UspA family protein